MKIKKQLLIIGGGFAGNLEQALADSFPEIPVY
jgi:hypothetical protein